jgi:hypothetical protein
MCAEPRAVPLGDEDHSNVAMAVAIGFGVPRAWCTESSVFGLLEVGTIVARTT